MKNKRKKDEKMESSVRRMGWKCNALKKKKKFPDKFRVSSFPVRFPHHAWTAVKSAHSDFDG